MSGMSRRGMVGGAIALTGLAACTAVGAAPVTPVLKRGVNTWPWFSLTREYPAPRTDYAWPPFQEQRPVPTPRDLARLRQAGLDFLRIPIDPGPFLAGTEREKAILFDVVGAAINDALTADLSVVVNIHANGATHYWNPDRLLSSTTAPGFPAYRALVGEIAGRLERLNSRRIVFEPVNEPGGECSSTPWRDVQMDLLTTARTAAPNLPLIATGGCGSMVSGLVALDPAPLQALGPLFFTFHFYEPYLFSHQGAPWMREPVYRALNCVPWPASAGSLEQTLSAVRVRMDQDTVTSAADKQAAYEETQRVLKIYFNAQPDRLFIDRYLGMVQAWGQRNGIESARILMGEFGALRSDARYVAAAAADRARYVDDVRRSAEAFGFPWAFWNLFDGMGMIDDTTRAFDPAITEALGLVMLRD
jgi:hypothetical protein